MLKYTNNVIIIKISDNKQKIQCCIQGYLYWFVMCVSVYAKLRTGFWHTSTCHYWLGRFSTASASAFTFAVVVAVAFSYASFIALYERFHCGDARQRCRSGNARIAKGMTRTKTPSQTQTRTQTQWKSGLIRSIVSGVVDDAEHMFHRSHLSWDVPNSVLPESCVIM